VGESVTRMLESIPVEVDRVRPEIDRIVPLDATAEKLPLVNSFAEGPVWNANEGFLLWTDAYESRILRWAPGEPVSTFLQPTGQTLAVTYDRQGRLVATGWSSRTIWRLEPDGRQVVLASEYQGKKINTPNDLVVKSDGSIYWTDAASALSIAIFSPDDLQQYLPYQAVFRLSADGSELRPVADDYVSPNGLAFSPDESILYVNDIQARLIKAYDVQPDGGLANSRVFYEARGDERGAPDGMKVDTAGNVYCTGPGGIHIIDPRGNLLGRLKLALSTNMCWGEADWQTFFVTTRAITYRIRLNVPGVPV
jgi:gluconolactonase